MILFEYLVVCTSAANCTLYKRNYAPSTGVPSSNTQAAFTATPIQDLKRPAIIPVHLHGLKELWVRCFGVGVCFTGIQKIKIVLVVCFGLSSLQLNASAAGLLSLLP